ncbi:MAG TPA: TonB-dependent receptor plug domain-containing protein, partial [Caulobacteraceae bacterium]|nr:TonB-dependent receptor plug domain-containing protein [Caulobacteraceae bacterium]
MLAQDVPTNNPAPEETETVAEVEEIVVLGRFIPEEMRETSEVSSFITAEDLKRQGDNTAAEALTRVTGLSLAEGKFVYVRGLGERYSAALLNGSPLPSPEPLQRVVPLDLFPTNILAGTMVQKTYSPRFPGEFGGGVIDLRTVSVPDEAFFAIGASVGVDTETSFRPGLTYYGSETDFLGFDDGTRDMPDRLQAAIGRGERVETGVNFTAAEIQAVGQSFVNAPINLMQRDDNIPADFSIGLSAGDAFDLGFGTLGIVATGSFDNGWTTRRGVQQSGRATNGTIQADEFDLAFESTQNDITSSGLLGLGLDVGPDHELKWTNLYIRKTSKEARSREGADPITSGGVSRTDYSEWFGRQLFNTQLAGEHNFDPLKISWRTAYAQTSRDAPYERQIRYSRVGDDYTVVLGGSNIRFSELDDELVSAGVDFEYTLPLSAARDAVISAGVAHSDNTRESVARDFRFVPASGSINPAILGERPDFLFADYNIGPTGLALQEVTAPFGGAAYEAGLEVQAAYVQVDVEAIPLVRVAGGVRYETASQFVDLVPLFGEEVTNFAPQEQNYWLP